MANRTAIPKRLQVAVFRRDGWLCCWCKRPVIFAPVMRFLEREIRVAGKVDPLAYSPCFKWWPENTGRREGAHALPSERPHKQPARPADHLVAAVWPSAGGISGSFSSPRTNDAIARGTENSKPVSSAGAAFRDGELNTDLRATDSGGSLSRTEQQATGHLVGSDTGWKLSRAVLRKSAYEPERSAQLPPKYASYAIAVRAVCGGMRWTGSTWSYSRPQPASPSLQSRMGS